VDALNSAEVPTSPITVSPFTQSSRQHGLVSSLTPQMLLTLGACFHGHLKILCHNSPHCDTVPELVDLRRCSVSF